MRSAVALDGGEEAGPGGASEGEVAVVAVLSVADQGVLGALGDLHTVLVRATAVAALVPLR